MGRFCIQNKNKILKNTIYFYNKEIWHWLLPKYNPNLRGYRYYKLKITRAIDRDLFFENIYPYCIPYCKEIEWLE